jgi:general secretion pathway protein A
MYEALYGFREKPFVLDPDPYFIFWSQEHQYAYAMLEYGIINNVGFTVITGEIGSGKTTVLRHLLGQIDQSVNVGLLTSTRIGDRELLQWIMMAFGQDFENISHVKLFANFQRFLINSYGAGQRVILVVDEAQNLGPSTLEELRMLSNINADGVQLLQTILVGQPQLRQTLNDPLLVQFSQRIGSDYHIRPLSVPESEEYIHHRTFMAGSTKKIFSDGAAGTIAQASKGIPRIINLICDSSLVYGFASKETTVSVETANAVISDRLRNNSFSATAITRTPPTTTKSVSDYKL